MKSHSRTCSRVAEIGARGTAATSPCTNLTPHAMSSESGLPRHVRRVRRPRVARHAAIAPVPADVITWRSTASCTSPATYARHTRHRRAWDRVHVAVLVLARASKEACIRAYARSRQTRRQLRTATRRCHHGADAQRAELLAPVVGELAMNFVCQHRAVVARAQCARTSCRTLGHYACASVWLQLSRSHRDRHRRP